MAIKNQLQFRRGSSSEWVAISGGDGPVLNYGEPGFDVTNNILKIGDGSTSWINLDPIGSVSGSFDVITFNNTGDPDLTTRQLTWNNSEGTLALALSDTYEMFVGGELHYRVRNNTGSTILAGTAVYATGLTPGGNNRIEVAPNVADGSIREVRFMGLMTEDCNTGVNGFTTHFGYIRNIDTRGDASANGTTNKLWASGEPSWSEGDILYVHPTVAGKLTKIEPKHSISVAIVLNRHANQGKLFVRPTSYGHLDDNHDVNTSGVSNNQYLRYDSATDYWVPTSSGIFNALSVSNDDGSSISLVDPDIDIYANEVLKLDGETSILLNSTATNSQVGIATAFPDATLDVAGDIKAEQIDIASSVNGATLFNIEGTNGNLFSVVDSVSGSLMSVNDITGLPAFEVFSDHSVVAGRFNKNDFVISSGGNVGIGTTTPSYSLDVAGDASFGSTGTNIGATVSIKRIGTKYNLELVGATDGVTNFAVQGASTNILWTSRANYFDIQTNSAGKGLALTTNGGSLFLGSDGFVGIGTFSPSTKLDVSGVITATGGNSTQWNTAYGWGDHANGGYLSATGGTITNDLIIGGNLTVNGDTVVANVSSMEIEDPILTLGLASGNVVVNDTLDRGIAMVTNSGTAFMGWDNSADRFVLLSSGVASNSSGNYDAGIYGDLMLNKIYGGSGNSHIQFNVAGQNRIDINSDVYSGSHSYIGTQFLTINSQAVYANTTLTFPIAGNAATSTATQRDSNSIRFFNRLWNGSTEVTPGNEILSKASTAVNLQSRLAFLMHNEDGSQNRTERLSVLSNGNVGIGTTTPEYKLQVNGSFGATTKSFRIDHPSRPNYTLEYGSLESPYHGVRLTGRGKVVKGSGTVLLPSYLKDLIHDDENINIQITNIKHGKTIYVDEIDLNNSQFTVRVDRAKTLGDLEFFWTFTGVRKDVDNLVVEREK